ncbi:MAG: M43 family zinc metalloprotease [Crocinitomicaceae bacterium]
MKKFAYILFILLPFVAMSQNNWCGTDAMQLEAYQQNPELEQSISDHLGRMHQLGVASDRSDSIIIPVVFHIIHDNGIGNISNAQVFDAMRMLNEDFNRLNADSVDTRNTVDAPFTQVAANAKICFQLAKLDPQGNCTDGIERRNSAEGSYNGDNQTSKKYNGGGLDAWNRSNYFNIWVVNSIASSGTGTILGYAQFPYNGNANNYGVIIRHDRVGSIGTAVSADRTLTHEVGHCFGLFHTFQGGCGTNSSDCSNQGDYCCDTPPVDQAHWSCNISQNFCNVVPQGDFYGFDAFDQYENFMSYSPCQNMFSEDQNNVMLYNFDTYAWLGNLSTTNNLLNTGVSLPATLCAADFSSTKTVICEGTTVDFSDLSHGGITNRSWSFTGGSPAVSSDSSVSVTYSTAGSYEVSIDVSDGANNIVKTVTNYITVFPSTGSSLPIVQGFESIQFPDYITFLSTGLNGLSDWNITPNAGSSSNKSVFYDNYTKGSEGGEVSFESGTIDLSNATPADDIMLSFDFAYRKKENNDNEELRVYISKDCGESWSIRKSIFGNNLSSQTDNSPFLPSDADWQSASVTNITSSYLVSNFRYKFVFESDEGNNIYIDNINIFPEASLALDENTKQSQIEMYPNPVTSELSVLIGNLTVDSYKIVDIGGQIVLDFAEPEVNSEGVLNVSTDFLSKGIYFISFTNQDTVITEKFIKP